MIVLNYLFKKIFFDKNLFYALRKIKFLIESKVQNNLLSLNLVMEITSSIYEVYALS